MEEGDFVHIDYTGRIKESGEIFDTTKEDVAKSSNVYNEHKKYRPVSIILGSGFVFKSLEEEIKKMNVGESKKIELGPDNAFGHRKDDLIKLIPISEFRGKDVEPSVGKFVNVNGINGKIISISGGRVKIDFNHPLAGKELVYEVEVKNKINEDVDKVKAIASYFTGLDENTIVVVKNEKEIEITLDNNTEILNDTKSQIAEMIRRWIKDIEKVKFSSVY